MAASSRANIAGMEAALGTNKQPTLFHPSASVVGQLKALADVMKHLKVEAKSIDAIVQALGAQQDDPAEELGMLPEGSLTQVLDSVSVEDRKLSPLTRSKAGMVGLASTRAITPSRSPAQR
jgi:hypothetical protein